MSWRHLYLWIAPLVMCLIDAGLTLVGQSEYYWGGYYQHVNEASPDAHTLLTIHPAVFVIGISVWMLGAAFLLVLLPTYLALVFSTIATIGHTLGAASWMVFRFQLSYQAIMGLCAVAGLLLATSITLAHRDVLHQEPSLNLHPVVRGALILALIAAAVYLFLVPH